jgi:hypothetical protein
MTEITQDDDYIEAVRAVAWGEEAGVWKDPPEGWPENVESPLQFVREYHGRTASGEGTKDRPEPSDGTFETLLSKLRSGSA